MCGFCVWEQIFAIGVIIGHVRQAHQGAAHCGCRGAGPAGARRSDGVAGHAAAGAHGVPQGAEGGCNFEIVRESPRSTDENTPRPTNKKRATVSFRLIEGTTVWRMGLLLHGVTAVLSQGRCKLDACASGGPCRLSETSSPHSRAVPAQPPRRFGVSGLTQLRCVTQIDCRSVVAPSPGAALARGGLHAVDSRSPPSVRQGSGCSVRCVRAHGQDCTHARTHVLHAMMAPLS